MRNFLLKYKYQTLLILIGICVVLVFNFLLQLNHQTLIYSDSDNYREAGSFFYQSFKAHYYRPLGMAIVFGIPYLFNAQDAVVYGFSIVINLLFWLGSAVLIFTLLKQRLQDKKAFLFTLLFYLIPGSLFLIFHLLTESFFTFLMLLSFYFLSRYYQKQSFVYLSVSLSILLFTVLVKPGIKFFAIVLFVYFIKVLLKNYGSKAAAFMYISLLMILSQCLMVRKAYGDFTITYIDGVTYYNYLGAKAASLKDNITYEEAKKQRAEYIFSLPYGEQKAVASKDMVNQLKTNRGNFIKAYLFDIGRNSSSQNDCINTSQNIKRTTFFEPLKKTLLVVSKYQNRLFSVLGCILALFFCISTYKKPGVVTFVSLFILYTIAISGVSCYQGDRFHIVFFPCVLVLIGMFYAKRTGRCVTLK